MPRTRIPFGSLGTDQSQFNGDGAFQVLKNLAVREPNMVEPLPGRDEVASAIGTTGNSVRRAWALTENEQYELLQLSGNVREIALLGAGGAVLPTVASDTLLGDTCGMAEARARVFYAGPRGALVIEPDASEARMLGMLPPTLLAVVSSTTTAAQAVPANSRVAWRATLHRKHSDGYEITSAPSYSMYGEDAGAGPRDYTVRIGWVDLASDSDERVREGDIVRLWRSRSVTAATSTNDRYQFTAEVVLDAADVTARYVDIRDITPDASLAGREDLYTNPGAQGALQTNWQLGPCTDVAVYNGHAFYAQRSLPSFVEIAISSTVGALSGAAAIERGIGIRAFTGTATNGSPTITGVSSTLGLVPGQVITGTLNGRFVNGLGILSVNHGASTVTFNVAATSSGAESVGVSDTLEITVSGATTNLTRFANITTLAHDLWFENARLVLTPDDVVNGELFDFGTSLPAGTGVDPDGMVLRLDAIAPYGVAAADLSILMTNSANYSPAPASDSDPLIGEIDERLNRAMWSKLDQPEHVPAINELTVGKGELVRWLSTKDVLFAFCTDGVYAITGVGPDWSVDRVDKDIVIASQQAVAEMNGNAYVYAKDRGLLRIERGGGMTGLTKGAVQKAMDARIADVAGDGNAYEAHVACDALHDEVGVFFPGADGEGPTFAPLAYVFNERTTTWRTQTPGILDSGDSSDIECWCYSPKRRSLVWGQGDSVYQNLPDDDLTSPIPDGALTTYPYVPDGDAVAMKRFHEVAFTISNLDTTDAGTMVFIISAGARALGETTSSPKALLGNEVATVDPPLQPALFQMRHMVTRQCAVSGHLVLNFAPENLTTRWRLHAMDVTWEPVGARGVNR